MNNYFEIPEFFIKDFKLIIDYDNNFYTQTLKDNQIIDVYTKNIIMTGSSFSYIQFINIMTFLLNEFEDTIQFSKIRGIDFTNNIKDLVIQIDDLNTKDDGDIELKEQVFYWNIADKSLILLLSEGFHQLAYSTDHIHICRDEDIEIFCEIE